MIIQFEQKEMELIKFLEDLTKPESREVMVKSLVKIGAKHVSKKIKDIPKPYRELLHTMLKEFNGEN